MKPNLRDVETKAGTMSLGWRRGLTELGPNPRGHGQPWLTSSEIKKKKKNHPSHSGDSRPWFGSTEPDNCEGDPHQLSTESKTALYS